LPRAAFHKAVQAVGLMVIAESEVLQKFDAAEIGNLIRIGKLSRLIDEKLFECFAKSIRNDVMIYAREARQLRGTDVHKQISELRVEVDKEYDKTGEKNPDKRDYEQLARLREGLSPVTEHWLKARAEDRSLNISPSGEGSAASVVRIEQSWFVVADEREASTMPVAVIGRNGEVLSRKQWSSRVVSLPSAAALRDPSTREEAWEMISLLCRYGAVFEENRPRSPGKRSKGWRWRVVGPELPENGPAGEKRWRHPPLREAEMNFLMNLRQSWRLVGGGEVPNWAQETTLGHPFVRMVSRCLEVARVAGAPRVNVGKLINAVSKRRRYILNWSSGCASCGCAPCECVGGGTKQR